MGQPSIRVSCSLCPKEVAFVQNTAVGERGFCSEKCYCEYMALPYHGEGYYGLVHEEIV